MLRAFARALNGLLDKSVNGTGACNEGALSGRCPVGEQRRPSRHPATARMMWSKDVNKVVMECYLKSKPVNENGVPIRGYRQRMFRVWQEIGSKGNRKIGRLWGIRHLKVVPVVVGALGVISNRLDARLEKLGVTIRTGLLQKTALLGTARILRKLLES